MGVYKRTEVVLKDADENTERGSANSVTEVFVDVVEGSMCWKEIPMKEKCQSKQT